MSLCIEWFSRWKPSVFNLSSSSSKAQVEVHTQSYTPLQLNKYKFKNFIFARRVQAEQKIAFSSFAKQKKPLTTHTSPKKLHINNAQANRETWFLSPQICYKLLRALVGICWSECLQSVLAVTLPLVEFAHLNLFWELVLVDNTAQSNTPHCNKYTVPVQLKLVTSNYSERGFLMSLMSGIPFALVFLQHTYYYCIEYCNFVVPSTQTCAVP